MTRADATVWSDPPPRRGRVDDRIPFRELDANPGRWALVLTYTSEGVAYNSRGRLERRHGAYEWRVGRCDVGWGVWGRRVPSTPQGDCGTVTS